MDQIQLLLIGSRSHSRSPKVTGLYIGLGRLFLWDFLFAKKSPVRDSQVKELSRIRPLSLPLSLTYKGLISQNGAKG